jgi:hypothetical protein
VPTRASPRVTVCIPSYNHVEFLGDAIDSVLGQSFPDFELIVVDDGSTDGSYELAQSRAAVDDRVVVLTHEGRTNRGIHATMNAAYGAARGDYVAALAADDVMFDESLARRVAGLDRDPAAGLAYGRIELLDERGARTGRIGGTPPDALAAADRTPDPLVSLLLHNTIPAPSVMFRREWLARLGSYDERVYYSDWELWIRFLAHSRAVWVDGPPLAGYRIHGHALTPEDDAADAPRRLDLYRLLDGKSAQIGGRLDAPRLRALVSLQRAVQAVELGETEEAREALLRAFDLDPGLGEDDGFLFWWLGLHEARRLPGTGHGWRGAFAQPRAPLADVVAAGAAEGHFALWALAEARARIAPSAYGRVAWALLADDVEAAGTGRRRVLAAALARLAREPRLLRERWFVKLLLCAAGLWTLTVRLRAATLPRGGRLAQLVRAPL